MESWTDCKNVLCIRADNMGDLLMSSPAIHALREHLGAKITVLTSKKASAVARMSPDIDEVIQFDLPWIKSEDQDSPASIDQLLEMLKSRNFDACVIFTVYSQNPLPAVMVAYMAGIPKRLAYCRENPYALLTSWVPDPEPLEFIRHQVQRDLDLVANIGALALNKKINLIVSSGTWSTIKEKLLKKGIDLNMPYLILHPGVSEAKREFSNTGWINCGKQLLSAFGLPLLITGIAEEWAVADNLCKAIGKNSFNLCGLLDIEEFSCLIKNALAVVSVNTGTVHLAAAFNTPVVVLYAQSNPQHTPWMVPHQLLEYSIPVAYRSKNKVIEYVNGRLYHKELPLPETWQIVEAVRDLLLLNNNFNFSSTKS
ncbi:glycosyl transferase [Pedobacter lusitanus]|uniref:Contig34, whole genome shotgun sequence n=2 Tax=Pedobacter lusitanus TaxID=1503925 RepID=A0A0D0GJQ3_9SPHI|nr:glycosyl transferase [Pedobacter lusitanus]